MRPFLLALTTLLLTGCASTPTRVPEIIKRGMLWADVVPVLHNRGFSLSTQCGATDRMLFGWPPVLCTELRNDRVLVINADEESRFVQGLYIIENASKPKDYQKRVSLMRFDPLLDPYEQHPAPSGSIFED